MLRSNSLWSRSVGGPPTAAAAVESSSSAIERWLAVHSPPTLDSPRVGGGDHRAQQLLIDDDADAADLEELSQYAVAAARGERLTEAAVVAAAGTAAAPSAPGDGAEGGSAGLPTYLYASHARRFRQLPAEQQRLVRIVVGELEERAQRTQTTLLRLVDAVTVLHLQGWQLGACDRIAVEAVRSLVAAARRHRMPVRALQRFTHPALLRDSLGHHSPSRRRHHSGGRTSGSA